MWSYEVTLLNIYVYFCLVLLTRPMHTTIHVAFTILPLVIDNESNITK